MKIEIIVLAAGRSQRMGSNINKLLLNRHGQPLVRYMVNQYLPCAQRLIVVLGHEHQAIRQALQGLPVEFIVNSEYEKHQQTSVNAGLRQAKFDTAGIMIGLADQPFLQTADLEALITAFKTGKRDKIHIPYRNQQRGNPVIFPTTLLKQLLLDNENCRAAIDNNPQLTHRFATNNDHYFIDIDTPLDAKRYGLN